MAELARVSGEEADVSLKEKSEKAKGDKAPGRPVPDRTISEDLVFGSEGEKERAIAKAALTVAELGMRIGRL